MKVEPGKLYQHYKNQKTYQVLHIAHHTETGERMVVYQRFYDTDDLDPKLIFVRPLSMFEEKVEHEGVETDRFRKRA